MNNEIENSQDSSLGNMGDSEIISELEGDEKNAQVSETTSSPVPALSAEVEEGEQGSTVVDEPSSEAPSQTDQVEDEVVVAIETLNEQLKETNRISDERERVIDRLHEENQRLKQGELQQAQLPLFRDLIRLHDDLKLTVGNYSNQPETDNQNIVKDFNCYRETIADILYRYGVEPIKTAVGEDFDPKLHKAVGTTLTEIKEQERKISNLIRDGFSTETRIIRNVEVEVYRFVTPTLDTAEQSERTSEAIESVTGG